MGSDLERAADLDRARALGRWLHDSTSTRVEPFRWGSALFNDEVPERFFSNFVRVERSLAGVAVPDLVRDTDEAMDGLGHRQIQIHDEDDGSRVAVALAEAGYGAEHSAVLAHRRGGDGTHEPGLVEEVDFEILRPFLVEVYRRHLPQTSPQVVEKFADLRSTIQQRVGTRFFARRIDGVVAGACELYLHEGAAQVEHVDTLEEFRGRGVASSIVLRGVSEATAVGADLVCIDADLDDWPIGLYRRLGFVEIGRAWAFTKPPAPAPTTSRPL